MKRMLLGVRNSDHEIQLRPWEEVIGKYDALKITEDEVILFLIYTPKTITLRYPKESFEAHTLARALKNIKKGTKVAILKTDIPQRSLIVRTLIENTSGQ